jgi:hypothetical protein
VLPWRWQCCSGRGAGGRGALDAARRRSACAALADSLDAAPRRPRAGATALGEALVAALALLARCPAPAGRSVIDVSGDGPNNRGRPPGPVRDLGVAAGVTFNGLAVLNEEPELLAHYEAEVIGGEGAFVMPCADYADFTRASPASCCASCAGLSHPP